MPCVAQPRLVGGGQQFLDDAHGIVRVQDREGRLEPGIARFLAQHLHAQRMEGADGQALGQLAVDQRLDALVHLARGLVGEGQRHHVAAHVAAFAQQVSDLLRDHPRLAAAGAGQHQAGAVQVKHRFLLRGIQAVANGFACGHFPQISSGSTSSCQRTRASRWPDRAGNATTPAGIPAAPAGWCFPPAVARAPRSPRAPRAAAPVVQHDGVQRREVRRPLAFRHGARLLQEGLRRGQLARLGGQQRLIGVGRQAGALAFVQGVAGEARVVVQRSAWYTGCSG